MKVGRLLSLIALVLVLPVGGLTSLAYASPPDPSWVHGIYDDADYDDVVSLITFESGTAAVWLAEPGGIALVAPVSQPSGEPTLSALPLQSRSPPAPPLPR